MTEEKNFHVKHAENTNRIVKQQMIANMTHAFNENCDDFKFDNHLLFWVTQGSSVISSAMLENDAKKLLSYFEDYFKKSEPDVKCTPTISTLCTGKGYERRGNAGFLLDQFTSYAHSTLKYKSVYLCVWKDNVAAINLYLKHGFKILCTAKMPRTKIRPDTASDEKVVPPPRIYSTHKMSIKEKLQKKLEEKNDIQPYKGKLRTITITSDAVLMSHIIPVSAPTCITV